MYKFFLMLALVLLPNCRKEAQHPIAKKERPSVELDFKVKNNTQKTLYVSCFYYSLREKGQRWGWHKSPVYKFAKNKEITIDIHTIVNEKEADDIYGYLGVFDNESDAHSSIFELVRDQQKVDLDRLINLKDKKIIIQTERYGFKGEQLDWVLKNHKTERPPELDFVVENKTEKTLYVAGFIYQRKEDHPLWIFDKTEVIKLAPNENKMLDVDTIVKKYDWKNVRGYLGIFSESEKKIALESTFELLKPDQKLSLGLLKGYKNKKVVIVPKKYGVLSGFDDKYPYIEFIIGKHRQD